MINNHVEIICPFYRRPFYRRQPGYLFYLSDYQLATRCQQYNLLN